MSKLTQVHGYDCTKEINMQYQVELLSTDGGIRPVTVPDDPTDLLERIFKYGQNDFQPLPMPSVSVGDVILLEGQHIAVAPVGFLTLTDAQYEKLKNTPRRDRSFLIYEFVEETHHA